MEIYHLEKDIRVFGITAKTFPLGIRETFDQVRRIAGDISSRARFGITTRNDRGLTEYMATVSELEEGESDRFGCITFTIPGGSYLTRILPGWKKKEEIVCATFTELQSDPRQDPDFPCVEYYLEEGSLMCMVRIAPERLFSSESISIHAEAE